MRKLVWGSPGCAVPLQEARPSNPRLFDGAREKRCGACSVGQFRVSQDKTRLRRIRVRKWHRCSSQSEFCDRRFLGRRLLQTLGSISDPLFEGPRSSCPPPTKTYPRHTHSGSLESDLRGDEVGSVLPSGGGRVKWAPTGYARCPRSAAVIGVLAASGREHPIWRRLISGCDPLNVAFDACRPPTALPILCCDLPTRPQRRRRSCGCGENAADPTCFQPRALAI